MRGRGDELAGGRADASDGEIFRQGAITNVLNPKVAMFFLAFLPQFVDPARGPAGLQTLALGLMFNVSGTLVNAAVAWLAGSARSAARVARPPCVVSAGERRDSHRAGTAARARAMNERHDRSSGCIAAYLFSIVYYMARRGFLGGFELLVLLALIRLGDEAYGVPISQTIEESSGRDVALGSVYVTLERLEAKRPRRVEGR